MTLKPYELTAILHTITHAIGDFPYAALPKDVKHSEITDYHSEAMHFLRNAASRSVGEAFDHAKHLHGIIHGFALYARAIGHPVDQPATNANAAELRNLREQLAAKNVEIGKLSEEITRLNAEFAVTSAEKNNLRTTTLGQEQVIERLKADTVARHSEIDDLKRNIEHLKRQIAARDEAIEIRNKALDELRTPSDGSKIPVCYIGDKPLDIIATWVKDVSAGDANNLCLSSKASDRAKGLMAALWRSREELAKRNDTQATTIRCLRDQIDAKTNVQNVVIGIDTAELRRMIFDTLAEINRAGGVVAHGQPGGGLRG